MTLRKATPNAPRTLRLIHQKSGMEKIVEYLGMVGRPHRAHIFWPLAGDYLVSARTGTIVGDRKTADQLRQWKVCDEDRAFLNREWNLARARAQMPGRALMGVP